MGAEIKVKAIAHDDQVARAQRDILMEEISRGSLLTRSWRPVLMYLIILFLLIYGFLLPFADIFTHKPIVFKPRWHELPTGLWNLLSLGVGGYIGGRSLEKIAASYTRPKSGKNFLKPDGKAGGWRRQNNFKSG